MTRKGSYLNWNRVQAAGRNAEAMARNEQEKAECEQMRAMNRKKEHKQAMERMSSNGFQK